MPRAPGEQQSPYYPPAHQQQRQQFRAQQAGFHPTLITTAYPPSTQYNSPISPLATQGSISPTSSKNYITRQIRPLYVPAVLRPTQFPSREPPLRPSSEDGDVTPEEGLRPSSSFMSLGGLSAFSRLSRRSTGDSSKSTDSTWNLDQFPAPTGLPTRQHWKPDQESTICDDTACKRHFSYFIRRHHCRKCGNIFCDDHSAFEIPLDQDANFNPRGVPSRACGHCYMQFKEWRILATGKLSTSSSPDSAHGRQLQNQFDIPSTPVATSPTAANIGQLPVHAQDAAHSVPRDWNWSTF
ncbi:uncharacterized protein C8A04DRAFT_33234 [Dichotomopilus funicola]|uniref:FYVE-type domain-containing protein n=1 Tax=Dichotomopilus funicola TaxID=1934379 RepID=A0AAN6ZHF1_9PEZI|nr:hypothetical protein C8A04DRAFT_33234 [Dichotomopilus funicola]